MRFLLATTALGTLAAASATSAGAEQVISTAVTTPLSTSAAGDSIRISSTGSVKPASGAAVTINSNNNVTNEGTIAIKGANDAVGIVANTNLTGNILNSGTITIDEDFTPTDSDNDGDVDGPFAQGNNRFGIHVLGGGTYSGSIVNGGTITIEGNQSAGIAIDSALNGAFASSGTIAVTGNDSIGIRVGAVSGTVAISGGSVSAKGANSIGLLIGGNIGALVIQGSVASTGYRSTTAPSDTSKLDSDDLLQGGSAVVVGGNVAGGILLDTTSTVTTFGSAPALAIGSSTQDLTIGPVASSSLGHGLVIKGKVSGLGVYAGVNATALSIGGTGHAVALGNGITLANAVTATASGANATAIHLGAGATAPQIVNLATISADGGGTSTSAAQAILIDSGATVNSIVNAGSILATRSGSQGTAAAIVDHSGTLSSVINSGAIGVTNASDIGDNATAIDVRATATGALVRQVAAEPGRPAPLIQGNIYFGSGNDVLDVQAGSILGKVDFGGGTDIFGLSGGSLFRGSLLNSGGLAVTVGAGSTLDVQNLGAVNLASLTTLSGANLGVTIGESGNTLYNVTGTATFGTGTKVLVTLDHVGTAAGTYTIIDAGTLVGAENLTSSIVTLPFLFNNRLTPNAATGQVALEIELKSSGELGLNASETAILDAALDASDSDRPIAALFLATADSASLKSTLQQLMPEHAGGAFETATKGSRLAAGILADPRPLTGLWLQQVAWGSTKSIGDTSNYDVTGWGANGGFDHSLGPVGNVGLTAAYFYGKDGKGGNELISNHYEGGVYWRGGYGPLRGWARATAGTIDFDGTRNLTGTVNGGSVSRAADGKWKGRLYSAAAGVSYEARTGRLSLRPNVSIDHYKLNEKGYSETGGGDAFDLTVRSRKSDETAANAMLSLGYDLMGLAPDSTWLRVELEGGRREILSGSLGQTVASFGDDDPFTLTPEQRTSGWRGGLRVLAGGSTMSLAAEASAEEQQDKVSLGGRVGVSFAL